jgi:hypothetical protein
MKLTALLLILTVPSFGWAQSSPAYPQAEPASDAPRVTSLLPRDLPPAGVVEAEPVPIYKRWYFWAGVGVVTAVVIATVTAVMLATRPAPPLQPAAICGPMGCDGCVGFSCP